MFFTKLGEGVTSKQKQAGLVIFTIRFCAFHWGSRPAVADFHDDFWKNKWKRISDKVKKKNVELNHANPKHKDSSPKSIFVVVILG